jgi:hypothetical protein
MSTGRHVAPHQRAGEKATPCGKPTWQKGRIACGAALESYAARGEDVHLPKDDTVLRFQLRTLLGATLALAVLAALAGWYYRGQTPTAQRVLLIVWSLTLLWAVAAFARQRVSARQPPLNLGPVQFEWVSETCTGGTKGIVACFVSGIGVILLVTFTVAAAAEAEKSDGDSLFVLVSIGPFLLGVVPASLLAIFLLKQRTWICDDGFRHGGSSVKWRYIAAYRWIQPNLLRMGFKYDDAIVQFHVPSELIDELQAFIATKVPQQ